MSDDQSARARARARVRVRFRVGKGIARFLIERGLREAL
jgi:hypothetical protein